MIKKSSEQTVAAKIGTYVQYQRQKKDLSLNELAKMADITPSFLLRLENGVYKSIKFDIIEKLAIALQLTMEDLLRKSAVISPDEKLPPLEYYLKEVYQLPEPAVDDAKLFLRFLKEKYKVEISEMKKAHVTFWGKKS